MIKELKQALKNKNGNGLILSCILVLVFTMLFIGIGEKARVQMTSRSVRDGLESIATTVSTNNSDEVFKAEREGVFSAYKLNETNNKWEENIEDVDIDRQLHEVFGVKKEGNKYIKKYKNGEIDFILSNIKVNINNPKIDSKETFKSEITANLEIHPMFGLFGENKINVNIGAKSGYTPKF